MESSYFNHKARTRKFGIIAGWILLGITAAVGFAFLLGYIIMLLWNWLMPEIFGLIEITYWQAVGIIILAKILFGGFGHHKSNHSKKKCPDGIMSSKSKSPKSGFAKWKYYDKFWKEEGEEAYDNYIQSEDDKVEEEN